jgi:hypothetical protein
MARNTIIALASAALAAYACIPRKADLRAFDPADMARLDRRLGAWPTAAQQKSPGEMPGLFSFTQGGDQYFATTGPVQLKR